MNVYVSSCGCKTACYPNVRLSNRVGSDLVGLLGLPGIAAPKIFRVQITCDRNVLSKLLAAFKRSHYVTGRRECPLNSNK